MHTALSINPIKGQQFTLYFSAAIEAGAGSTLSYTDISKDAGTFVSTTNSASAIAAGANSVLGRYSLVLTATEMNADVIVIICRSNGTVAFSTMIIYTQPAELTAAPTLNSSIADKITAIFQYLFFKRIITVSTITLKKSDGITTLATGTVSDDGTTVTKGALS